MSESGVIPPPGDRQPGVQILGHAEDIDGLRLYVGVHHDRVCLEGTGMHGVHLCFAKDAREQFMRLWCEAERQAEAGS